MQKYNVFRRNCNNGDSPNDICMLIYKTYFAMNKGDYDVKKVHLTQYIVLKIN